MRSPFITPPGVCPYTGPLAWKVHNILSPSLGRSTVVSSNSGVVNSNNDIFKRMSHHGSLCNVLPVHKGKGWILVYFY